MHWPLPPFPSVFAFLPPASGFPSCLFFLPSDFAGLASCEGLVVSGAEASLDAASDAQAVREPFVGSLTMRTGMMIVT